MFKALLHEPDGEDLDLHHPRCSADLLTLRTHELVPMSKFVGGRVRWAGEQGASAEIPLLPGPMNQNGIHLAANHYFLVDWVVALALMAALPGVTLSGVHDPDRSTPIQIWTTRAEIKHLAAGTGTIEASCSFPAEERDRIRSELVRTTSSRLTAIVQVRQDERVVAVVEVDQIVFAIVPRAIDAAPGMIQAHQEKLSAMLIAGLRAEPEAAAVAGTQGRSLAERMSLALPQLPSLVHARSQHLDRWLASQSEPIQVLVLGIGLDTRPRRFPMHAWFGVDLESSLELRKRRFAGEGLDDPTQLVAADLRGEQWKQAIHDRGLDPSAPTLVVLEGVSMYLERADTQRLLDTLAAWLSHADSRVWLDHVAPVLLSSSIPGVRAFLHDMARLGEPFITGVETVEEFGSAWVTDRRSSAAVVAGNDEPVHTQYLFTFARRS